MSVVWDYGSDLFVYILLSYHEYNIVSKAFFTDNSKCEYQCRFWGLKIPRADWKYDPYGIFKKKNIEFFSGKKKSYGAYNNNVAAYVK